MASIVKPFLFSLVAAAIVVTALQLLGSKPPELPVHGAIGSFALTSADEQPITEANLRGKVTLINFFFSSCPNVCPRVTSQLAALYKKVQDNPDLQFLSISIDPKRDTPAALRTFAEKYQIDRNRWLVATGPLAETGRMLLEYFKLGQGDKPEYHTTYLTLVDHDLRIRGYYHGNEAEGYEEALVGIRALLR